MIFGTHPLDGENTRIWYGRVMDDVKALIADDLEAMREGRYTHADMPFMGYVFALNQLATEDPAISGMSIYSGQVAEWEEEFLTWLDGVESTIPKKHRAGYRAGVLAQFEKLKSVSSPMPKDMW